MSPAAGFTCTLALFPRALEGQFWSSPRHRHWARNLDHWGALLTVAAAIVVAGLQWHDPGGLFSVGRMAAMALIPLEVGRYVWLAVGDEAYFWWRPWCRLLERACRLAITITGLQAIQHDMDSESLFLDHLLCYSTTSHTTLLLSARNVLVASGAAFHFLQACIAPLSFLTQCLVQAGYLAFLLAWFQRGAVALLAGSACSYSLTQLCNSMNCMIRMVEAVLFSIPQDHDHFNHVCSTTPAAVLVPYAQFAFAFLLPVYVAYRLEWNAKAAFLMRLQTTGYYQAQDCQNVMLLPFPHLLDILLLAWFAAVGWIGVMHLHPLLAQVPDWGLYKNPLTAWLWP